MTETELHERLAKAEAEQERWGSIALRHRYPTQEELAAINGDPDRAYPFYYEAEDEVLALKAQLERVEDERALAERSPERVAARVRERAQEVLTEAGEREAALERRYAGACYAYFQLLAEGHQEASSHPLDLQRQDIESLERAMDAERRRSERAKLAIEETETRAS
jgi:chemotaxis response regulator CheB